MTNIIADKMILPELVQEDLNPINLADAIQKFISDESYYLKIKKEMIDVKNIFSSTNNAINNVASHIKKNINEKN